jgi:hypothetical protein
VAAVCLQNKYPLDPDPVGMPLAAGNPCKPSVLESTKDTVVFLVCPLLPLIEPYLLGAGIFLLFKLPDPDRHGQSPV